MTSLDYAEVSGDRSRPRTELPSILIFGWVKARVDLVANVLANQEHKSRDVAHRVNSDQFMIVRVHVRQNVLVERRVVDGDANRNARQEQELVQNREPNIESE